ncbi:MAG: type II secretion system ATPase GspE [Armatimonadota bacterium]|nr:type II secretion system ATPase GspE [Armatimonadota bacterium]
MQRKSIGAIFVNAKLITEEQLNQAIEKQRQLGNRETIGDVLVSMGLISERDKVKCLGIHWGVPYVDLTERTPEPEAIKLISQEIARRYKILPIARENGKLTLAMKNPLDIFATDEVRLITGLEVEPVIATEEDIMNAISQHYGTIKSPTEAVSELIDDMETTNIAVAERETTEEEVSIEELRELSEEAPVVRLANLILTRGIQDKCSDIHIEPGKNSLRVRYRIDGILHDGLIVPKKAQASLISRLKIMANMDIAEKRAPQDGRISAIVDGKHYDFRVSTLPSVYGEKVVLRVLDKNSVLLGLNKLGFLPETLEMFESIISRTYGIILVTGPTGSGKSTTLYSVLNKLNSGEKNILTIEDPVEYELEGITQTQVNVKAGLTFASGLRTMLRQDPDIIMVGEIRDQETAMIAIEAALTGHLVLATLHTNDAPGAITRLLDMGVESFLIASAVIGVLAQRLLRTICPKCKEMYTPPRDAIRRLGMNVDENSDVTFYRGKGCDHCKGTGYKGRIGIYELMPITDKIRDLILAKSSSYAIKEAAIEAGMKTLKDDAMEKILLGLTTLEESLRVIYAG